MDTDAIQIDYVRPDDATLLEEVVEEKCAQLSEAPGLEVEFCPDEADMAGAFEESALSVGEAWEGRYDEQPYAEGATA